MPGGRAASRVCQSRGSVIDSMEYPNSKSRFPRGSSPLRRRLRCAVLLLLVAVVSADSN